MLIEERLFTRIYLYVFDLNRGLVGSLLTETPHANLVLHISDTPQKGLIITLVHEIKRN